MIGRRLVQKASKGGLVEPFAFMWTEDEAEAKTDRDSEAPLSGFGWMESA
jgi:hypothetical protein